MLIAITPDGMRTEPGSIRAVIWTSIPLCMETDTCAAAGAAATTTRKKTNALVDRIAGPFDSHVNGLDRLEAPQVVDRAERFHDRDAIANREDAEPHQSHGERNRDRQRDANARAEQNPPPRLPLTEHAPFERVRSFGSLPFMQQTFQQRIVTGFHTECLSLRVAGRASASDSRVH